jgi:hypothetical protein
MRPIEIRNGDAMFAFGPGYAPAIRRNGNLVKRVDAEERVEERIGLLAKRGRREKEKKH